jgi:hypothetical protein
MNKEALRQFVQQANKEGYGSGKTDHWVKEKDGSTTIPFAFGDFRMSDNFFGGEPYGGREVVFFQNAPVWIMVYYGKVNPGEDFAKLYKFLQKALLNAPDEMPVRGPKVLEEEEFTYVNEWKGEIEEFSGEESISKNGKTVYNAKYVGGLVDQRKEN